MIEAQWTLTFRDPSGRRRRGTVMIVDQPPRAEDTLEPTQDFAIAMLNVPHVVAAAPPATAICVPAVSSLRDIRMPGTLRLPTALAEFVLPPHRMEAYANGRIVTAIEGLIEAPDVFLRDSDHPDFQRLAIAVLSVADAEAVAPYIALVRHSLGLASGTNALDELGLRLAPEDPHERPPARAPGISRLAKALRLLRQHAVPDAPLEQFAEDLVFLRMFSRDEPWPAAGLESLLTNVRAMPPRKRRPTMPGAGADAVAPAEHREPMPFPSRRAPTEDA